MEYVNLNQVNVTLFVNPIILVKMEYVCRIDVLLTKNVNITNLYVLVVFVCIIEHVKQIFNVMVLEIVLIMFVGDFNDKKIFI